MSTPEDISAKVELCPEALQTTIETFQSVGPRDRLELLLEYADDLPDLPERLHGERDAMEQVHECQSTVFLRTEIKDGRTHFLFDVPPETPTVRGYASILQEGFDGVLPEEVLSAPEDVYRLLGLQDAISPLRLRGLHALMVYMKRQVQRAQ